MTERPPAPPSRSPRVPRRRGALAFFTMVVALVVIAATSTTATREETFTDKVRRIDKALKNNPAGVPELALYACQDRRNTAMTLYRKRQDARAERSLRFCFQALKIPERAPAPPPAKDTGPTKEQLQAKAAAEIEAALALEPNVARGLEIYRECAMCHEPEGWGLVAGSTPQIAGQHRTVVIKQLADFRAGNRVSNLMLPYASIEAIGGPQAVADVAGYIDSLEMSTANGKGDGSNLDLGEKIYRRNCSRCHGASGEGNADEYVPRIQSQHYKYLLRQFEGIKSGKRHNADPEMAEQIADFNDEEVRAVLDYVSRLQPPPELIAPEGWYNPDFARRSQ